jgi:hypothetical protein
MSGFASFSFWTSQSFLVFVAADGSQTQRKRFAFSVDRLIVETSASTIVLCIRIEEEDQL